MSQPNYSAHEHSASFRRSFAAMRTALRMIVAGEGDCTRQDEHRSEEDLPCECAVCIAKSALQGEEDWRFDGYHPGRRGHMPREAAMNAAWKHYFKRSAGRADGTSMPMDAILSKILFGEDRPSEITERDWYVATTIVQWLATNVGQCVLFDAGYQEKPSPPSESR